jgi:YVTN family beta-propeller protein
MKNIPVGWTPLGVVFDPANGNVYVSAGTVYVINSTSNGVIKNIPVGLEPAAVAFDSYSHNIIVANQYSNTISIIDGSNNKVVDTIRVSR